MIIKGCEIKVIQSDITDLEIDAIVNPANNKLVMGGGVAGAIRKKGGKEIENEAVKKGPIKIGEAIATQAGELKAKYVIHAATMSLDFQTDEIKIREAAKNSLRLAKKLNLKSIAFPALGCGTGGFPLLASAKIMSQEVFRHLREDNPTLKTIVFCLCDKEAFDIFNKGVLSYLDYITHKLQNGPFTTVDAVIEINYGIILIERSNPPFGWALPGGFVDYGESLEDAVRREVKEETNVELEGLEQFHTYSDPGRDPRFHTIGTVFIAKAKGKPKAGDDAASFKIVQFSNLLKLDYAFDHKKIIEDYLRYKKKK